MPYNEFISSLGSNHVHAESVPIGEYQRAVTCREDRTRGFCHHFR